MPLEPQDLIKNPRELGFSKIQNVTRLGEAAVGEFLNGLYLAAVRARESGDWESVERFLQEWEDRATSITAANALRFEDTPWTPLRKPLSETRVALLTTGGVYVKDEQEPYNTDGDVSFRPISLDLRQDALGIAHTHYATSNALKDINVVFPYERMREMAAAGVFGSLAATGYSFMGFIPDSMVLQLTEETAPQVARRLLEDGIEAALIGTT